MLREYRHTARAGTLALALLLGGTGLTALPGPAAAQNAVLVSEFRDNQALPGGETITGLACISGNGDVIGFYSEATNLAPVDNNGFGDLFVLVRGGGDLERVNVSPDNEQADAGIYRGPNQFTLTEAACSLSQGTAANRKIAFATAATNMISGDAGDNIVDVFVRDLISDSTVKVSRTGNRDSTDPTISGDGRWVAFLSTATNLDNRCSNGRKHVYLADLNDLGSVRCVTVNDDNIQASGDTLTQPDLSGDGRYLVFDSDAANLVDGDTNSKRDIFLFDRVADTIRRVSIPVAGGEANGVSDRPVISTDGSTIAFVSAASNLVSGDTNAASGQASGTAIDVFVYNRANGQLLSQRANVTSEGGQANAVADGVSISPGIDPAISGDGRYIAFVSSSTNLSDRDRNDRRDVYVRDRTAGETILVSATPGGLAGNNRSFRPDLSDDGQQVVFDSIASDLIAGDSNNGFDVFLRAPEPISGDFFKDDFEAP